MSFSTGSARFAAYWRCRNADRGAVFSATTSISFRPACCCIACTWSEALKSIVSPGCHIRFMKHSLIAGDASIASGIPFTNKFGMMLVKREPGPRVIRSALPIASSVSCIGFTLAGFRRMRRIGDRLLEIRVSPSTQVPSFSTASNTTLVGVEGKIRAAGRKYVGRMLHGFREIAGQSRQGGEKQVAEAVAFQTLAGIETILKQSRQHRFVFRHRHQAVADIPGRQHGEISPKPAGTAAVIGHRHDGGQIEIRPWALRMCTSHRMNCFNPCSRLERPVPPPIATMRKGSKLARRDGHKYLESHV